METEYPPKNIKKLDECQKSPPEHEKEVSKQLCTGFLEKKQLADSCFVSPVVVVSAKKERSLQLAKKTEKELQQN